MASGVVENELDAAIRESRTEKYYKYTKETGIKSIFSAELKPIGWYSLNHVKLPASNTETQTKYSIPSGYHHIAYSYLRSVFPPLRVRQAHRDEIRFAWCYDSGYQVTESAEVVIDDNIVHSIDTHFLIGRSEYFRRPGFDEGHDEDVGNVEDMTQWNTMHKRYVTRPIQPWFYANRAETAFPLYRLSSQSGFSHIYTESISIASLIRMQQLRDGEWVQIPTELDYLDGVPPNGNLEHPQLWGCLARITADEIEYNRCKRNALNIMVETVIKKDDDNPRGFEGVSTVNFDDFEYPCKTMIWMSENVTARSLGNRSIYGTDNENPFSGENPMSKSTLQYGSSENYKFRDMEPDHFTGPIASMHFPNHPRRPGVLAYPFTYFPTSIGYDVGAYLKDLKAKLSVKFKDPNVEAYGYFINRQDPEFVARQDMKFNLRVRLIVLRELIVDFDQSVKFLY